MVTFTQRRVVARYFQRTSVAILIALTLGVMPSGMAHAQQDVHSSLIAKADRKPATNFDLVAANGKNIRLTTYRNKVVLLNFWATKCGGCILEIPAFIEIQKAYETRGFIAVGISVDIPYEGLKSPEEAWKLVRPFMLSHKLNYPILMGDGALVDVYGFPSYPATYLLDRSGKIAASYIGVVAKGDVEANIDKLLVER